MKLFPVIADNWKMDGGVAFGVVPRTLWSRAHEADHNNMIRITTRCLLIVSNGRKILIDAGLGDKRNEKYYAVRFREEGVNILNSLQQLGFTANDITDVLFTHLHDDHIGAATRLDEKGNPVCVFGNAHYWVSEIHWEWALKPNRREKAAYFTDNLEPLQQSGRLHLLKEGEQPFENIILRTYNGHTRGQLIPFIQSNGNTIVFVADFIPMLTNIPIPYIPAVDIEPLVSMDEKEQFLAEAAENQYILLFEHDAHTECCTVVQSEKGMVAGQTFKLEDIKY